MYDAALGRWHAVDPMSEKYYSWSPYTYCMGNPMSEKYYSISSYVYGLNTHIIVLTPMGRRLFLLMGI